MLGEKERQDYEHRVKKADINSNGLIMLGANHVCPTSPFGKDLRKKYPRIEKAYQKYLEGESSQTKK